MNRLVASGFVNKDTLALERYGPSALFGGQIGCLGGIVITVGKKLIVTGELDEQDCYVRTEMYTYHAAVSGHGSVLRYDNQHPDQLHPGHHDPHHLHLFNWRTSEELPGSPKWIGAEKWPTLGEVIEEIRKWHSDNYRELPLPDSFPERLERGIRF